LGWFTQEIPPDPTRGHHAFFIRSLQSENGALLAQVDNQQLSCLRNLQNIPLYVILILREHGTAYYAASIPGAHSLPAYPHMRPLAIDTQGDKQQVYAGVHQSVLGQIGFRADTRLYSLQVKSLPQFRYWYGSAHTADRLTGDGNLEATACEKGGVWQVKQGAFERTATGIKALDDKSVALVKTPEASSLIHVILEGRPAAGDEIGLIWRYTHQDQHLEMVLSSQESHLECRDSGAQDGIYTALEPSWWQQGPNSVQIRDDGAIITCILNGRNILESPVEAFYPQGTTLGIRLHQDSEAFSLHSFEAHPMSLPIPTAFQFDPPPHLNESHKVIWDNFTGAPGADIHGKEPASGGAAWHKQLGAGTIEFSQNAGAVVRADARHPNPGRTIYTLLWENPNFAALQVEIQAPGSARFQGEKGRGGLVFWQDSDNYIIINTWLDDYAAGASISSFFRIKGFEEIYDAIWTNIGTRISWGQTYRLRVAFDGIRYLARVNDEAVLLRALTDVYPGIQPVQIKQVGIVANWEWGNDTGSRFLSFEARTNT
jgi:hypothetical protein